MNLPDFFFFFWGGGGGGSYSLVLIVFDFELLCVTTRNKQNSSIFESS